MTITFITQAELQARKAIRQAQETGPFSVIEIGNRAVGDKSGYLGLKLNVNANGKAIRIALRDNSERVHILLDEVDNLIEALVKLKKYGVPTSTDDVPYDALVARRRRVSA